MPTVGTNYGMSNYQINMAAALGNKDARDIVEKEKDFAPLTTATQDTFGAYYKGYSGLSSTAKEEFDKMYGAELSGRSEKEKDNFLRNKLFTDIFKNSDDPTDQKIWNDRKTLTRNERDILFARKAIENDLDGLSDIKETKLDLFSPDSDLQIKAKKSKTLRDEAQDFLLSKSEKLGEAQQQVFEALPENERKEVVDSFLNMSEEFFPNYREYKDTDRFKAKFTEDEQLKLAAKYKTWNDIAGPDFAYRMLSIEYQKKIAETQNRTDKILNAGAQFVDSGAGMIIRAAGMAAGVLNYTGDEGESYFNDILDNPITRYGDRVAKTQSWSVARQKYLEENGLQDNPILNTFEQQNSLISANTPYELIGQYGFTAATTLLSFGGGAGINLAAKGASLAAKGVKGANLGTKLARGIVKGKDVANVLLAGALGTVEGGMNAVDTRNETLKNLTIEADKKYRAVLDSKINDYINSNPEDALKLARTIIRDGRAELSEEDVSNILHTDDGVREYFSKDLEEARQASLEKAEEVANKAMTVDFIGNSIINGFINSTWKASLNSPRIQRSLRKFGLQKSALDKSGLKVVQEDRNTFRALAKRYTRGQAFKDRLKEAWGEGVEEYLQDLSSGAGEGVADNIMSQFLEYKYGNNAASKAFEEDVESNIVGGLRGLYDAAFSKEAAKSGLYGFLSTALGGPNININNSSIRGKRQEGESKWHYFQRKTPITWRTSLGALISNDINDVNKQRQETADRINKFFSDDKTKNVFLNLEATTSYLLDKQEALENGKEKEARDAALKALMGNLYILNELEGSGYHDLAMRQLETFANFNTDLNLEENPDSAEAQAVSNYFSVANNRGDADISAKEALENMKKSATKMLELNSAMHEEMRSVEKLFGADIDRDTKEALVLTKMATLDEEERINQINKELDEIKGALRDSKSTVPSLGLNAKASKIITRYGSLKKAQSALDGLEALKKEISDKIEDNKKEKNASEKLTPNDVKTLKRTVKGLEPRIKDLNNTVDSYKKVATKAVKTRTNTVGQTVTEEEINDQEILTAAEIMNLNAQDRAEILDEKNAQRYSAAQREEINKVNNLGQSKYKDFDRKIQDVAALEKDYDRNLAYMRQMSQDPTLFNKFRYRVMEEKRINSLYEKYSFLEDYHNDVTYEEYANKINTLLESSNEEEASIIKDILEKTDSTYYNKYKESKLNLEEDYRDLSKSEKFKSLDGNKQNIVAGVSEFLNSRGIYLDNANVDNVTDALNAVNTETGNNAFTSYIEDLNTKVDDNQKVNLEGYSIDDVVGLFLDTQKDVSNQREEWSRINRTVEVEEVSDEKNAPAETPIPASPVETTPTPTPTPTPTTIQPSPEEAALEETIENSETPTNNNSEEVNSSIEAFIKRVTNTNTGKGGTVKENVKKTVLEIAEKIKNDSFDTFEDFYSGIKELLDPSEYKDIDDIEAFVDSTAKDVESRKILNKKIEQEEKKPSVVLEGLAGRGYNNAHNFNRISKDDPFLKDSQQIESYGVDYMYETWADSANSPAIKFLNKYNVREFLANPENFSKDPKNPTKVKFFVIPWLVNDVKEYFRNKGGNYNVAKDLPVVPVVEVEDNEANRDKASNGHLLSEKDSEGKIHYYQPIGYLPTTGSKNQGSNNLAALRIAANKLGSKEGGIVKDKGKDVESTLLSVERNNPKYEGKNRDIREIGNESLSYNDKKELEEAETEESKKNTNAYNKLKNKILKHLKVANRDSKFSIESTIKDPESGQEITISLQRMGLDQAYSRSNPNKKVISYFESPTISYLTLDEALNSNSRIRRFSEEIKKLIEDVLQDDALIYELNKVEASKLLSNEGKIEEKEKLIKESYQSKFGKDASIDKKLKNYFYLPGTLSYASSFQIVPTETGYQLSIVEDFTNFKGGKNIVPLYDLGNTENFTRLSPNAVAYSTLHNLIYDDSKTSESGTPQLRTRNSGEDTYAIWQIPYNDVRALSDKEATKKHKEMAQSNIEDIYDDGLLGSNVTSLSTRIDRIAFEAPIKEETKKVEVPTIPIVANPDNASSKPSDGRTSMDESITKGGEIVDTSTGAVVENKIEEAPQRVSWESDELDLSNRQRKRKKREVPTANQESDNNWDKLDSPMRESLSSRGITKEAWDTYSEEEKKQQIDCCK